MRGTGRLPASLIPAAVLGLLLGGCARPTCELSGSVRYKGKAVETGTVTVFDAEKRPYQGNIDDGQYRVGNIPEGPVRIIVVSRNPGVPPPHPPRTS